MLDVIYFLQEKWQEVTDFLGFLNTKRIIVKSDLWRKHFFFCYFIYFCNIFINLGNIKTKYLLRYLSTSEIMFNVSRFNLQYLFHWPINCNYQALAEMEEITCSIQKYYFISLSWPVLLQKCSSKNMTWGIKSQLRMSKCMLCLWGRA